MRCEHENAEHMMPGESSTPDWCVMAYAEVEQFRCIDCGSWLSLGPAGRVDPDELALAELLADVWMLWGDSKHGTTYERKQRAERENDMVNIMAGSGPAIATHDDGGSDD